MPFLKGRIRLFRRLIRFLISTLSLKSQIDGRKHSLVKCFIPSDSFNIQSHLEIEGFFTVKVFLIGVNLCLPEETKEGMIQYLISEGISWWKQ